MTNPCRLSITYWTGMAELIVPAMEGIRLASVNERNQDFSTTIRSTQHETSLLWSPCPLYTGSSKCWAAARRVVSRTPNGLALGVDWRNIPLKAHSPAMGKPKCKRLDCSNCDWELRCGAICSVNIEERASATQADPQLQRVSCHNTISCANPARSSSQER